MRTLVALSPARWRRASEPVVDRTGAFPTLTIVAVPTIRPWSIRTEVWRTRSGDRGTAASTRTPWAEARVATLALAAKVNERDTPTRPISTCRSRRDARGCAETTRVVTDRNAALAFAHTNTVVPPCNRVRPEPEPARCPITSIQPDPRNARCLCQNFVPSPPTNGQTTSEFTLCRPIARAPRSTLRSRWFATRDILGSTP